MKQPIYQLIEDETGKVIKEGSYFDCLGAFQRVSGFSYANHKIYSHQTYTIKEIEEIKK